MTNATSSSRQNVRARVAPFSCAQIDTRQVITGVTVSYRGDTSIQITRDGTRAPGQRAEVSRPQHRLDHGATQRHSFHLMVGRRFNDRAIGAWVLGDLDTHNCLCLILANESGCRLVGFRLSIRSPAAVFDVMIRNGNRLMSTGLHLKYCSLRAEN